MATRKAKPHNRAHLHEARTTGERIADGVATSMGSWRFIIIQTAIVALWMACNVVAFIAHWDSYPFILLNLLFSTQAAYAAPIIMMSQNRQAARDRKRDDLEAAEVATMLKINRTQLQILELLKAQAQHDHHAPHAHAQQGTLTRPPNV